MKESLADYNEMFHTNWDIGGIQRYNENLNKRLARKDSKYKSRNEQLDLVIVVDRLLTGFDAPCMSTIFIDRQPMGPHDLIQAFSRTNRVFDARKTYGQIVTFQAPLKFKEAVDEAIKLYSAGGTIESVLAEWEKVEPAFKSALAALRACASTPDVIPGMSIAELKVFVKIFQTFDRVFAQLRSFSQYSDDILPEYGITMDEYADYVGHYRNATERLKKDKLDSVLDGDDDSDEPDPTVIDTDYELLSYSNIKIDYEYIVNLIQNIITPSDTEETIDQEERQRKIDEIRSYINELSKESSGTARIMEDILNEIEMDDSKYRGESILNLVETRRLKAIEDIITDFCVTWYASKEDVEYAASNYRDGKIPNEGAIKITADYTNYKKAQEKALPKFRYYNELISELIKTIEQDIKPLSTI